MTPIRFFVSKEANGTLQERGHRRLIMTRLLASCLKRFCQMERGLGPNGPQRIFLPGTGLLDFDKSVDAVRRRADAIVMQKGPISHHSTRTSWGRFVCHASLSTIHGGDRSQDKVLVATPPRVLIGGQLQCLHKSISRSGRARDDTEDGYG